MAAPNPQGRDDAYGVGQRPQAPAMPRVPAPDEEDLEEQGDGEILLRALQNRSDSKPAAEEKEVAIMCELICLAELVGGFFIGILFTLGVLALIALRWTKRAKKPSSHSLDTNMHFQDQG